MTAHIATAAMLIRCLPHEAFNAFVEPARICSFWLDRTSGPLAAGVQREWNFMVAGATERVQVKHFVAPRHLAFTWLDGGLDVDMTFSAWHASATVVSVEVRGFRGDDVTAQLLNAAEGFSIVLCDLKVLLESGKSPNLVRDKAQLIAEANQHD